MAAKSDHPLYLVWQGMKSRCTNSNGRAFPRYGGRGITVCQRWLDSFDAFLADMGERPSPEHSIDRIDNDGDYEPGNCRWATREQQQNNTRRCDRQGEPLQVPAAGGFVSIAEASRQTGIPSAVLSYRVRAGWTIDRIYQPVRKRS